MAADFDRFLDAVQRGTALDARAPGQRFVPPAPPEPTWHAVRDDLEQTLQNLHVIRDALMGLQRSLDEARGSGARPGPDVADGSSGPSGPSGPSDPSAGPAR